MPIPRADSTTSLSTPVDALVAVRQDRPAAEHGERDHVVHEADPEHGQERGDQDEARQGAADDRRSDRDAGAAMEVAEHEAERERDDDRDRERGAGQLELLERLLQRGSRDGRR